MSDTSSPVTFGKQVAIREASPLTDELRRIAFVTLGCPKNQVDSEVMLGHLDRAGYRTTGDLADADVAVVNTCAFLESAIKESIDTILEVAEHKTSSRLQKLVIAGCLTQRYGQELLNELPEVDAVMGTGDIDRIVQVISGLMDPAKGLLPTVDDPDRPAGDLSGRVLSTSIVSPYLKISEGCSAKCTFCIIPQLRGPGRSRTREELVGEAERLVSLGAKELVLIAQDLTAYGMDLYDGKPSLGNLLRDLNQVEGLHWVRLMYANPFFWDEDLIDAFATLEKVVPYADMPVQHLSDRMLKVMGRQTDQKTILTLIDTLRSRVPNLALRTNIIAGFPGETDQDFEELMRLLAEIRFEKLVAFPYSAEDGTAAVNLRQHVSEAVTVERVDQILTQQGEISLRRNREQVGNLLSVLIEKEATPESPAAVGRSHREAPEVDGAVHVAGTGLRVGEFYSVRITGADAYDLVGMVEGHPTENL
ncbi:MAG: 30S ribosomal protein S12 methylthiotransferase RimO [Candidatus Eisenbacteria bacterium]|uniref:Ribosomal protein uS12 methylthiotransferase RimO n=1 Tax=Eiseniibacteriota bacterium TaxID=2212470 RepID=A0A7Y2H405_UNCEI|nr:30S ribosomal protein S12 methylthiotransferase RimO [Candidatus Eisenbacteria bacterium]